MIISMETASEIAQQFQHHGVAYRYRDLFVESGLRENFSKEDLGWWW